MRDHRRFALVAFATLAGCFPSRGPVDLHSVDTKVVSMTLDQARNTICPGQPVPITMILDVEGDSGRERLLHRRQTLDDAIFDMRQMRFSSPQGTFDADGVFYPDADVLRSAQSGFSIYVRAPRGPTFSVRYPPSYECTAHIGRAGPRGQDGVVGRDATVADLDQEPGPNDPKPLPPATGRAGEVGGQGGAGPSLVVFVTWVRTPDYTRLLAARSEGDVNAITFVAPGTPLVVVARGGGGGKGGRGGAGGTAVDVGAMGGRGGEGGGGGAGGVGGNVELRVDERFYDDLTLQILADVDGGEGGAAGEGGSGGSGYGGDYVTSGKKKNFIRGRGTPGAPGPPGPPGRAGTPGSFHMARADVSGRFDGLAGVLPYP